MKSHLTKHPYQADVEFDVFRLIQYNSSTASLQLPECTQYEQSSNMMYFCKTNEIGTTDSKNV